MKMVGPKCFIMIGDHTTGKDTCSKQIPDLYEFSNFFAQGLYEISEYHGEKMSDYGCTNLYKRWTDGNYCCCD
jgi:hypothetical protein